MSQFSPDLAIAVNVGLLKFISDGGDLQTLSTHFTRAIQFKNQILHEIPKDEVLEFISHEANIASNLRKLEGRARFKSLVFHITSPFAELFTAHVEVRDSPIHGKGVFTTAPIKKGGIITFYPPHCLLDKTTTTGCFSMGAFTADNSYKMNLNSDFAIYGDPQKIDNPLLLGHMINDAASINLPEDANDFQLKNEVVRYILNPAINAMIQGNDDHTLVYILAMKDIPKGAEILVAYSTQYWLTANQWTRLKRIAQRDTQFRRFLESYCQSIS